jgi:hypothetical protein
MEVTNAIWFTYLLGGTLTLIEDIGAPTCFCASYNVRVRDRGFLRVEVEGKYVAFLKLSLPTPRSNASLTFESDFGTTTSLIPSIIEVYTCDLEDYTTSSNFISWLIIFLSKISPIWLNFKK